MANNREELLLRQLLISKRLSIQDAMDLLNVSKSTARRIFIDLENRGAVVRTHGGVQLSSAIGYSFDNVKKRYYNEKLRIGNAACDLVENGDVLFLDAGTTSMNFAIKLAQKITNKEVSVKSIYTNSIALLDVFPIDTSINLVGGMYRPERKDLCGYISDLTISHLHFTKCFLGTDGIINDNGFGAIDYDTAQMNTALLRNSTMRIVLCDHSKFHATCHVSWASFSAIDKVVTDKGTDEESLKKLRNFGCEVILA